LFHILLTFSTCSFLLHILLTFITWSFFLHSFHLLIKRLFV
jgi:hypothetical protein